MLKIAVNLFLASPRSITGAFVYIEGLLPALFAADRAHTYYLCGHAETIEYFKAKYKKYPNVEYCVFDIRRDAFLNPLRAARKLIAKWRGDSEARERIVAREVRRFIAREHVDVYFSPSQAIYPRDIGATSSVTTMLDLQFEYFPEHFGAAYRAERRRDAQYAVERSRRLIAISAHTKQTLVATYAADPATIKVIYFGLPAIEDAHSSITPPREFVLYPAALWPHKNHDVLIRALGILKDRFPVLHAVCTGVTKREDVKHKLEALAEVEGVQDRIIFTGFVSNADLQQLYGRTKALVFPSSFEGFGIPLVEAMQFGVPVIAADNTSITEVVADAGILVPTGNAEALADAIERVLTDEGLRHSLIEKGRARAKLFSWDRNAQETLDVFKQVSGRP